MVNPQNYKRLILVVVLITSIAVTTGILIQLSVFSQNIEDAALSNAAEKAIERESFLKAFTDASERTITALRHSTSFEAFLDNPDKKEPFEELVLNIASSNRDIMGIRFLQPSGMEVVPRLPIKVRWRAAHCIGNRVAK